MFRRRLLAFTIAAVAAAATTTDTIVPFVVALDSKSALDEFVATEPATIIKFYAPWCGHCKRVAPTFEEAGAALKGIARLGDVDCTQHKEVCQEYGVRGYPTLLVFDGDGKHEKFAGQRTVDAFVDAVRAHLPPEIEQAGEADSAGAGEGEQHDEL